MIHPRWESVHAAHRRVNLAKARLEAWPYDEAEVRYALRNTREAVEFLERALQPRKRAK